MVEAEEETSGPIHRTAKDPDGTRAGAWEPNADKAISVNISVEEVGPIYGGILTLLDYHL